jgi:hypothetical protein
MELLLDYTITLLHYYFTTLLQVITHVEMWNNRLAERAGAGGGTGGGAAGGGGAGGATSGHAGGATGVGGATALRVTRVQRVHNPALTSHLERTSRCLASPGANRSLPPQGGYFHGTTAEATAAICQEGFDPACWRGGRFGLGQYLSASAAHAAAPRCWPPYTQL